MDVDTPTCFVARTHLLLYSQASVFSQINPSLAIICFFTIAVRNSTISYLYLYYHVSVFR